MKDSIISKFKACLVLFFFTLVASAPVDAVAQGNNKPLADWSAKVLATKNTGEKEFLVCTTGGKGVPTKTLARLVAREKHGPAVASAAGQYFEKAIFDEDTLEVLRMLVKRPDIGAQCVAYIALSPKATDLIIGLTNSKSKSDQQTAARMLAATAVMRKGGDRAKKHIAEKIAGSTNSRLDVDYKVEIEKLLTTSRDEITLEYALLAVGIDRIAAVKDAVAPHAESKHPGVAMAAQFALAATKQPIDEEAVLNQIERAPRRKVARPALSYDPRQTPREYAIRAAAEARLTSATEPLLGLIGDKDLHTAVAASRALGRIGGKGIAVKLVEAMDEQTPWPVRVALYNGAGLHPDKAAVPLLRQRFGVETGRFRQDALYALLSIVAGQPEEMTVISFDGWWAQNGESFKVDVQATRAWRGKNKIHQVDVEPVAGFYESSVISDRPVFSVDASKSMKGAQIESLKQTLLEVVASFPDRVKFNIVDFGGHVRTLARGAMIPSKNRKQAMQQFIYEMKLTFGTRSYDAIERGMQVPGMDTVHFLSDGAPYGSHLRSWGRIEYATRLYCQTAPVAVHAIYFPNPGKGAAGGETMKKYANANAGRFHVIQAQPQNKK